MGKVLRLPCELKILLYCFGLSALFSHIYCNRWPNPPAWHPSTMVLAQYSTPVRFNLIEDASAPFLFPSSCIIYLWLLHNSTHTTQAQGVMWQVWHSTHSTDRFSSFWHASAMGRRSPVVTVSRADETSHHCCQVSPRFPGPFENKIHQNTEKIIFVFLKGFMKEICYNKANFTTTKSWLSVRTAHWKN